MLRDIIANTPLWVWALLAFLIYRGVLASIEREVPLKKLFIIPLVMLALSLHGIAASFGSSPAAAPVWLAGMAAGSILTWYFFNPARVSARPQRQAVALRGSWVPLMLMLGIFFTKYTAEVALVLNPALKQDGAFIAFACTLYGLFNGVFIGQLLRIVTIYREGVARSHKLL